MTSLLPKVERHDMSMEAREDPSHTENGFDNKNGALEYSTTSDKTKVEETLSSKKNGFDFGYAAAFIQRFSREWLDCSAQELITL